MISAFDKNGKAEHFRREFIACLRDEDCEGALDNLIKYSEETKFKYFHLVCGMLYLQMTNDSDDSELLYMAYREFMLQIVRTPDCRRAYRNLVITDYLRTSRAPDCEKWCEIHGVDYNSAVKTAVELTFLASGAPFDFSTIFGPGEYGEIDPYYEPDDAPYVDMKDWSDYTYAELRDMPDGARSALIRRSEASISDENKELAEYLNGARDALGDRRMTKVIEFNDGGARLDKALDTDVLTQSTLREEQDRHGPYGKFISRMSKFGEGVSDGFDEISYGSSGFDDDTGDAEIIDHIIRTIRMRLSDFSDDYRDADYTGDGKLTEINTETELDSSALLRLAETYYDARKFDSGLAALDGIKPDDSFYFYALCLRALIYIECKRFAEAESTLEKAMTVRPYNALCGTLICRLYEETGRSSLIPNILRKIDLTSFMNGEHVYKAFRYALKYCGEEEKLDLIGDYIDEYNIMDMRLIYAQLMYNCGERDYATKELYKLTRILYDDFNVRMFYLLAKSGAEQLPVDEEVPQEVLTFIVQDTMRTITADDFGLRSSIDDMFMLCIEFFISLEFRNDRKVLESMFETLRRIASEPALRQKALDSLVSPYVEPLAKAIMLGELFKQDKDLDFLVEIGYKPIAKECVATLDGDYSQGYYTAYAYTVALCDDMLASFVGAAAEVKAALNKSAVEFEEKEIAYYLVKRMLDECGEPFEARYAYALGFPTKTKADRAYASIEKTIK